MADKRGLVASYPFAVPAPEQYQPRNEERFRAQMAQANAEIYDRLANIETDVDAVEQGLAAIPPPPTVPAFATDAQAVGGTSADTIISPATLKVVLDTLAELIVPTGAIMYFAGNDPPGWLNCDGAVVTTANAALRDYLLAAGSPYGATGADPLLPDLRGEFVRGADLGRGVDAGRIFGSFQGDEIRSHSHSVIGQVVDGSGPAGTANPQSVAGNRFRSTATNAAGGSETRPRNVSLRACIKT